MYRLELRSAIAVWLMVSCSVAHTSSVADYRITVGNSVAGQWLWMNASGGEVLTNFTQIISTSLDQNSGSLTNPKGSLAILNRYSSLFVAATYSPEIIGDDDYRFVLDSIRYKVESIEKEYEEEVARILEVNPDAQL